MNLILADVEEHYVVQLRAIRTKLRPARGPPPTDGTRANPNPMHSSPTTSRHSKSRHLESHCVVRLPNGRPAKP